MVKKFKNVNEFIALQEKILSLLKNGKQKSFVDKDGKTVEYSEKLNLLGCLIELNVTNRTYYNYVDKYKKNEIVKDNDNMIRMILENQALTNPNPIQSIFVLKSNFGYIETDKRIELDLKQKDMTHKHQMDKAKLELEKEKVKNKIDDVNNTTVVVMSNEDVEKL